MTDEQLDWAAMLFIYHKVASRHAWTFDQFLTAFKVNQHHHLLEVGA